MNEIMKQVSAVGIVPVIKLNNIEDAVPLAGALIAGGMPTAEVTFRAEGAEKVIAAMAQEFPELLVGAGTVVNMTQAKMAVASGARFVVSPGFDAEIAAYCLAQGVVPLPGCVTPTEIQMALRQGLEVVKFFPAKQYGGLETIKALAGPFSGLKFMPTGGIDLSNLAEYAADQNVAACGGSFMVTDKLLSERNWTEITRLSAEAVSLVRQARAARV